MNPHFATLVFGLAHQANAALDGQLPPGADQVPGADGRQIAQTLIDTLGMLQDKTAGRLDPPVSSDRHALVRLTQIPDRIGLGLQEALRPVR